MDDARKLLRECREAIPYGIVDCRGYKCRQLNCTACFGDDAESYNGLLERIDALLAQPAGDVRVPEGWKLVPVEPTAEMLATAAKVARDYYAKWSGSPSELASAIYKAMLAAKEDKP